MLTVTVQLTGCVRASVFVLFAMSEHAMTRNMVRNNRQTAFTVFSEEQSKSNNVGQNRTVARLAWDCACV